MNLLIETFLGPGVSGDAAAREGGNLDLNSESVSRFVDLLKRMQVVIDPAMNAFEAKYAGHRDTEKCYGAMTRMLKLLYHADVSLVIGTDAPRSPGVSLHREMEIWVEAGVPAPNLLQMTTIGAARVMSVDRKTGSIRIGKKADLVLIDGDPIQRISDIRKRRILLKERRLR
jgi:imidazolonepropionase-like amidohydrolase